jgi:hypothetical protein
MHLLLSLFVVTLTIAMPGEPALAQSTRYVLTSVEQNIDVGNWQITARETGVVPGVPWSVRRQRLHGGKQDGVDLIVIDNGRMTMPRELRSTASRGRRALLGRGPARLPVQRPRGEGRRDLR